MGGLDLVIAGAQKSGTSSLTSLVGANRGVTFLKQSTIFEGKDWAEKMAGLDLVLADVRRTPSVKSVALNRPNLLGLLPTHERIAPSIAPGGQVVVLLRNPIERSVSAYFHYMRDGLLPIERPDVGLRRILRGWEVSDYRRSSEILTFSLYGRALASLKRHVSNREILVWDFKAFVDKPSDLLQALKLPESPGLGALARKESAPHDLDDLVDARDKVRAKLPRLDSLSSVRDKMPADLKRPFNRDIQSRTISELHSFFSDDLDLLARVCPEISSTVESWLLEFNAMHCQKPHVSQESEAEKKVAIHLHKRHPRNNLPALSRKEFSIGLVQGPNPFNLHPIPGTVFSRDEVEESTAFVADPFLFEFQGLLWVFYETRLASGGAIAAATFDSAWSFVGRGIILQEPWHISFPQLVWVQGRLVMSVESVANNSYSLYECEDFPYSWVRQPPVYPRPVTDPTLVHNGDEWFAIGTDKRKLMVIPLSTDLRTSQEPFIAHEKHLRTRMGGHFFVDGGALYRPSQRNQPEYGFCTDLHLVNKLSATSYAETEVCSPFLPRFGQFDQEDWCRRIHHVSLLGPGQRSEFQGGTETGAWLGVIDGRDRPGPFG